MRKVEHISTVEEFETLQSTWSCLLERGGFHTVFQTFPWLFTWWRFLRGDNELFVLAVKEDDVVVGIAPLMRSPQKEITFIGTPNTDYNDIIGPDKLGLWTDLLRYLRERRSEWNSVTFSQVTERAPGYRALGEALAHSGHLYRKAAVDICPGYEYEGTAQERSTFELPWTKGTKKALRDIEKLGGYTFRRLDLQETLQQLPMFFHLHIVRWDQTATPSKFTQEAHRQFYVELAKQLDSSGVFHCTMMAAGGVPVGYCVKFAYGGTMYHYALAHNPYFSRWSPGIVFIMRQTELLVREGFVLDFSRGLQDYKSQIANRVSCNYRFDIFSSPGQVRLHDIRNRIRWSKLARRLWEYSAVSAVRSRLARVRRQYQGSFLAILWQRAVRLVFQHRIICVYSHQGEPADVPTPALPVEIRELTAEQLPLLATFYGVPRSSPKYRTLQQRFEQGGQCHGVFHNDVLATVGWGLPYADRDRDTGFMLAPGPHEVVVSDLLTMIPYRKLGLQSYLLRYQLAQYCCRNQRALIAVEKQNAPMQSVVRKFNFVPERTTHIIRILSIHIT